MGWEGTPPLRNFHAGYPGNGVENEGPVIIDGPVAVVMPADKTGSAGSLFRVFAPEQGLRSSQ